MIARDVRIALHEDAHIHLQHLSSRWSIEEVAWARARGGRITCEATPHHLALTDAAVRSLDSNAKMNPPLGDELDRQALIAAVRDGTVDRHRDRPRAARGGGEGGAARGRAVRRDRARDGLRRDPHRPDRARPPDARGGRRAHDGRPCNRARAARADARRRRAREPRALGSRRRVDGAAGAVPLEERELVLPRPSARRPVHADRGGGSGRPPRGGARERHTRLPAARGRLGCTRARRSAPRPCGSASASSRRR